MRWTQAALADEPIPMRTAKACGPDTPTLVSSLRVTSRRRRWPKSPVHRGEHAINRKLSRRECRCFGLTCGDYAHVLLLLVHGAMGAAKHPAFPAPSLLCQRAVEAELGRMGAAGMRRRVSASSVSDDLAAIATTAARPHSNANSTRPNPWSSMTTRSPALSQTVFTRLPVSTTWPACRPLPSPTR
jgi:hypothetical protein